MYILYIYICIYIQYYKYELVLTPTECSTFYGANVTGVKKNSKIRLEVSSYSCNHQVFKFNLVLKITKIHIKLTKVQKYFSASSLNILSIHAIIAF